MKKAVYTCMFKSMPKPSDFAALTPHFELNRPLQLARAATTGLFVAACLRAA